MARVVVGEKSFLKTRDVPLSSLIGWGNTREALDALFKAKFDEEAAVKELQATAASTGYWRDKFVKWDAAEAELVCDAAARHHDDLHFLSKDVLSTDKSPNEVIEFYDHFLRSGADHAVVTRLFSTAEYSRSAGGGHDTEEFLKGQSAGDGGEAFVALRKSKRARAVGGRLLPGEKGSDSENEGGGPGSGKKYMQSAAGKSGSSSWGAGSGGGGGGVTPPSELGGGAPSSSSSGGGGGGSGSKRMRLAGEGGAGGAEWFEEHQEQFNVVTARQQELLKCSFAFLHAAQDVLDQKTFFKLVKHLVEYDKGCIEVSALVHVAAECLPPHDNLLELFKTFLPDKSKPMLSKLVRGSRKR